jgi:gas vesicle structural protein
VSVQPSPGGALERSQESSSLADVVNTILDKGVVVDVFARVSLVGIELLRADVRIVIASVDTYLRFAEAVNRLEMGTKEPSDLTEVVGDISEAGTKGVAKGKSKGALEAGVEKLDEFLGSDDDADEEAERPRRKREGSRR